MVKKEAVGFHNGYKLWLVTLTNSKGMEVKLTNYSGAIVSITAPDRDGNFADVTLGYDDLEGFINGTSLQGAICGRCANRISGGKFTLNGVEYLLYKNDGDNTLHGGSVGYHKRMWELVSTECLEEAGKSHVVFGYISPDGEENFPGALHIIVDYCLDEENQLTLTYNAMTDADTVLNLTNHVYFNLAGGGSILDTEVEIYADKHTPTGDDLVPTGELADVKGTEFDFTYLHPIKELNPEGYDHNFALSGYGNGEELHKAAFARDPKSGRTLTCFTDLPAMQFYTGVSLTGETGKGGVPIDKNTGFCFETHFFPDSPNKPQFPSCVLKAGDEYHHVTVYRFGTDNE